MDIADLRVIIPVGGEARRLKPLTAEASKAVVRIFNKPLVEFAMVELALQGVKNFIFGVKGFLNYRGLFAYYQEGIGFSARYGILPRVHIKYQPHIKDVGSADSIRVNLEYYDIKGDVMVVQGDNLFELDLAGFLSFHEQQGAIMTVVLTYVDDVERYGIAILGKDNRIVGFVEKPQREKAPSRLANTGIYLLSPKVREIFDRPKIQEMIKRGRLDFGMDFIPFLIQEGYPVYGFILEGQWYDVGTPEGYLETMTRVLNSTQNTKYVGESIHRTSPNERDIFYLGEPPLELPDSGRVWIQGQSPESIKRREHIINKVKDGKIRLGGTVLIGRHCQIGDDTIIRDSCIDNFCIIGDSVTIERSAIMDRVLVGNGTYVQDSIIGRHVSIESSKSKPTWILGLSVVGDNVVVGENCMLTATKIFPNKAVQSGVRMANEAVQ